VRALGAILAGGQGRRFGSDKAAAMLGGKPLIEHVADALIGQVETLVVVGRSWPGLSRLDDRPEGALGPLAGLNAALHHAQAIGLDGVVSAGCDTLPVPPGAAALLMGPEPAFVDGHFLLGWWPTRLASRLERHLAEGKDRSMRGWIAQCSARAVPPPAVLHNLNTQADLDAYARITAS
jgi:molybdopterin-guanine dinucleotide biosynthesis protein A